MTKVKANIYCKIYCDSFPYLSENTTSDELYEFLLSDCNQSFDSDGNQIKGDKVIWYLGCNEKFGIIELKTENGDVVKKEWGFGESSFLNVREMLEFCSIHNIFNSIQLSELFEAVEEGEKINDMYLISEYLQCKEQGKPWTKNGDGNGMRNGIKKMMTSVKKHFESKGDVGHYRAR